MSRIRFAFSRDISMAYISHLDMMRLFIRALRRSSLPLEYSQGYNPHPRFMLALPLPVSVTADYEIGEAHFIGNTDKKEFIEQLGRQLPEGLQLKNAMVIEASEPSIAALAKGALYRATLKNTREENKNRVVFSLNNLLAREEINIQRTNKKKKVVTTNVRPFIIDGRIMDLQDNDLTLELILQAGSSGGLSPVMFLELLEKEIGEIGFETFRWHLHRKKIMFDFKDVNTDG